mmetsp:Transcript_76431/g.205775  ORF Transcript_76431/g.205775 Transcript_76431/m.205775 type:complete len:223 (-) Transcript_76431:14-682(-)
MVPRGAPGPALCPGVGGRHLPAQEGAAVGPGIARARPPLHRAPAWPPHPHQQRREQRRRHRPAAQLRPLARRVRRPRAQAARALGQPQVVPARRGESVPLLRLRGGQAARRVPPGPLLRQRPGPAGLLRGALGGPRRAAVQGLQPPAARVRQLRVGGVPRPAAQPSHRLARDAAAGRARARVRGAADPARAGRGQDGHRPRALRAVEEPEGPVSRRFGGRGG